MSDPSLDTVSIPKWFLRLSSAVLALAIPWACWVTLQLATISVKIESAAALESRFQLHLSDPSIHHAGVQRLEGRVTAIEHRLEILEKGRGSRQ